MNKVEVDKQLSAENFRTMGLEWVIQFLLPVIREIIFSANSTNADLQNKLNAELIKNEELHKVIKAIGERKNES